MLIWYPPNRHARLASVIVRVIRSAIILARWFGSRRGVGLGIASNILNTLHEPSALGEQG